MSLIEKTWNDAAKHAVLSLEPSETATSCNIRRTDEYGTGHKYEAITSKSDGTVRVASHCSSDPLHEADCLRAVLSHETGHSLGLGHVDDPLAVMYCHLRQEGCGGAARYWKRKRVRA